MVIPRASWARLKEPPEARWRVVPLGLRHLTRQGYFRARTTSYHAPWFPYVLACGGFADYLRLCFGLLVCLRPLVRHLSFAARMYGELRVVARIPAACHPAVYVDARVPTGSYHYLTCRLGVLHRVVVPEDDAEIPGDVS